jgi:hypothetical protein
MAPAQRASPLGDETLGVPLAVGRIFTAESPQVRLVRWPQALLVVASSTSVRSLTRLAHWVARPDDGEQGLPMDVIVDRCAGLDVH